ncbi:vacuolar protein sorting-associated protein 13 isoform X2 [Cimex lectularius]|uniref:Vacuolar protein sorting-associated protein 13 n=1 Tax=Cimex lectularius TaxID=79782 RepID=A0A8I6TJA8_CIMLE|nr:vacuolar protein sorting-associated protein 13 isoform X2 [Cimex lectularius]
MVFESILVDMLNKYLGQYVENLDSSQLKVGIWGGNVVLHNLYLRANTLDELDLPVKTLFGCLGTLTLQIPWNNLYNAPVVASIDSLYILAVPNNAMVYDPVKDEKYKQEAKQEELKLVDLAKKRELANEKKDASLEQASFIEKLSTQIIKNVEVTIKNIHIRFEDKMSCPGRTFALGITLDTLSVKTTTNWEQKLPADSSTFIFKELIISCLCLYWNSDIKQLFSHIPPDDLLKNFKNGIAIKDYIPQNYQYMLGPLNASSKLRINPKPENDKSDFTVSKIYLTSDLPDLSVKISKNQFQDILCVIEAVDLMQRATKYRKYRPNLTTYIGHSKEWWQFAYTCILEEEVRRRRKNWSWANMKEHRDCCKEYLAVYKEKLQAAKQDEKIISACKQLEEKLDVLNIILLRERVEMEVLKEEKRESTRSSGSGWFSGWWFSNKDMQIKDDKDNDLLIKFENAMTIEEKKKLFRAIGYTEGALPTTYPKHFVKVDIELVLHKLHLLICNFAYEDPVVLSAKLQGITLKTQQRENAILCLAKVGSFNITGCAQKAYTPQIVNTIGDTKSKDLLEVLFETNPLDSAVCDKRFRVSAQPLHVLYDLFTIQRVSEVFLPAKPIEATSLQSAVQMKLTQIKEMSTSGVQHLIEKHEVLELDIYLKSSVIIIPKNGILDNPLKSRVVISLGTIKIKSVILDRSENTFKNLRAKYKDELALKTLELHSYDHFNLKLTELQIVLGLDGENLEGKLKQEMYILKPLSIGIEIQKCILPDDPRLPRLKVSGTLPGIHLNIAVIRLQKLMELLLTLSPATETGKVESEFDPGMKRCVSSVSVLSLGRTKSFDYRRKSIRIKPKTKDVVQFTELVLDFELKQLTLSVLDEGKHFLDFSMNTVNLDVTLQTYTQIFRLKLFKIEMIQMYKKEPLKVIQTSNLGINKNYLFSVEYINVDKHSPEFHTVYGSVMRTIKADFTGLRFYMHCEGLLELVALSKIVMPSELPSKSKSQIQPTLQNIEERGANAVKKPVKHASSIHKANIQKKASFITSDAIDLKIELQAGETSITLATVKQPIMDLQILGGHAGITLRPAYTQFTTQLNGINLINLTSTSSYTKIISLVSDKESLKATLVLFNEHPMNVSNVDIKLTAKVSRLRFIFIKSFLDRVVNFMNHFQDAEQAFIEASQAAAEAAKQNVQVVYQKATKVELQIDLQAPIIYVPINEESNETFILDFGSLKGENSFLEMPTSKDFSQPAILDRIRLQLDNLKLSRATIDENLSCVQEISMITPITFKMSIQRNLSSAWFSDIPDLEIACVIQTICICITHSDYVNLMKMMDENIFSVMPEDTPTKVFPSVGTFGCNMSTSSKDSMWQYMEKPSMPALDDNEKIVTASPDENLRMSMKFLCNVDEVVVKILDPHDSTGSGELAKISLNVISLKGSMLSDNSLQLSLLLLDLIMEDTRQSQANKICRYMQRKKEGHTTAVRTKVPGTTETSIIESTEETSNKSMVDIIYQQKKEAIFANVRVCSFVLILNVEHLLKVAAVFTLPPSSTPAPKPKIPSSIPDPGKSSRIIEPKESTNLLTFNFKCEHPDIILVERLDDIDTNALVMHCEVQFKWRISGSHQTVSGSINDLQLFSCCYNPEKRKSTKIPIIEPVSIILAGTTPKNSALHVDLSSTNIRVSVTPGTIQLLSSISSAITGSTIEEQSEVVAFVDRTDMWDIQKFEDTDYHFLKTELGVEATDTHTFYKSIEPEPKSELCVVYLPSIVFVLESGVGITTMPVLHFESAIRAYVRNWSSLLNIESNIHLQISYFNHTLALWEPILEPVEETDEGGMTEFAPWGLSIQVETNKINPTAIPDPTDVALDNMGKTKPAMYIHVTSKEVLPLTLTKTCLNVLNELSINFSDAIYKPTVSSGMRPQYVIVNDSGLVVTVKLDHSEFKIWGEGNEDVKEVILDPGANLDLALRNMGSAVSSPAIFTSTKAEMHGHTIDIFVNDYKCDLRVPISRADKRYFSLNYRGLSNDTWGLVSAVAIQNGCTTATLRGIIQIKNGFNVPVSIYYMTKKGNEVSYVTTINPNTKLNLPLEAIYTPTSELFFSFEGYSVSVVPFLWKDLQQSLHKTVIMQCYPKNVEDKDPLFFRATGELEQIYYENTKKHTMASACYNITLRPTVIFKNLLPINIEIIVQGHDRPSDAPPIVIPPGQTIQVPTAEPGYSSLIVTLPDYLDRDWCCKHKIEDNADDLTVWTFESYENIQKVTLDLGIHTTDVRGSILMELYCPFWMINKTGLILSYKRSSKGDKDTTTDEQEQGTNILYHPNDFTGPILFSFKAKNFFAKKKSQLRVFDGQWSEKFSLDVAGSAGMVSCVSGGKIYDIGITIQLTYSTLTKQVMFTPFFVVVNHWSINLEFQETSIKNDKWRVVKEKDCIPFWPVSRASNSIRVRVAGTKESTVDFTYKTIHHSLFKLENKYGAVVVDIQVSDGGTYIALFPYEQGMAPALIINHTSSEIEVGDASRNAPNIKLQANEQVLFSWLQVEEKHLLMINDKTSISIQGDGLGSIPSPTGEFYWTSFLYGLQRVLLFTEQRQIASDAQNIDELHVPLLELEIAISGIGLSLVDNIARAEVVHMGITSSGLVWMCKKKNKKRYKPLSDRESTLIEDAYQRYLLATESRKKVDPQIIIDQRITVDFVLMEMLKPTQRQLKRAYKNGFWFNLIKSQHILQMHAKINRIQIDNQMFDCTFPVVFAPVPPPKSIATQTSEKPFVEVSIVKRVNEYSFVQQYKYFKVLVQEFDVRVDIGFVNAIASMLEAEEDYDKEKELQGFTEDLQFKDKPLHFHVVQSSIRDQKHFYDYLHLSPLKIHLSFTLAGSNQESKAKTIPPVINLAMQSLGVTLTDVQGVIFKLGYFEKEYCFLTGNQLIQEAQMHYFGQLVKQLYVLVLGLDVIGNPFGLVLGIGQGAADFFYEPFQGAIQGPGEFATGLVYGVRSLIGHTVGGAAGAVSKITGAMGKGIAALTFDKEYQRHRRELIGHKPSNFQEGLAQSGKGLVMGVVDGVTGVIRQPIYGAKDEGLGGFCKGVGKGLVGLVTRPIAGITDFASGSFSAVKRATDMAEDVLRMRSPRCIQVDGLVRPFSKREAEGLKLLMSVEKGKFSKTDMYIYHILLGHTKQKDVLLLTDKRIAYISINEIFGGYQMDWAYRWTEISTPSEVVDKGVMLFFSKKRGMKTLFQTTDSGKLILIDQEEIKKTISDMINELVEKHSRMDLLH